MAKRTASLPTGDGTVGRSDGGGDPVLLTGGGAEALWTRIGGRWTLDAGTFGEAMVPMVARRDDCEDARG